MNSQTSKTDFLKEQLMAKGVYDYTEEQLRQLKVAFIECLVAFKCDRYEAFDRAFAEVFLGGCCND